MKTLRHLPILLMMALMASGMNGQHFAFEGYLSVKPDARRARIAELERLRNGAARFCRGTFSR